MTFPGTSTVEWTIVYWKGRKAGLIFLYSLKLNRVESEISYLEIGHKTETRTELFEPLFPVLYGLTERSGVGDTNVVLVQRLRDKVQISRLERLIPFVYEFDLRGFGAQ